MNNAQQPADVIGNNVSVEFPSFGGRSVKGKVDTGATTSSLHATKIDVNQQRGTVTFYSEVLSENMVTLELHGVQEVHSADAGGVSRPVVVLDAVIAGKSISGATFNLNDRSNMDTKILIGQNILKAAGFVIDVSQDAEQTSTKPSDSMTNEVEILRAIEVLVENRVSLADIVAYLKTAAINRISE